MIKRIYTDISKSRCKVVADKKHAYIILILAICANIALAVGFKMYFFESPLINVDGSAALTTPPALPVVPELPEDVQPVAPEAPQGKM